MKRILLWIILLAGTVSFGADEILFPFTGDLPDWAKSSKTSFGENAFLDRTVKLSGTGSLKLTSAGSVLKRFKLDPDAEYEVSVYVKGENIKGEKNEGASILLSDDAKYYSVTEKPLQGTFDWTKCMRTIKSSFFTKDEIYISPRLTGSGTVWFDDLKVTKKAAAVNKTFRQSLHASVDQVVLVPGGTFGFFDPGQEVPFRSLVKGSAKNLEYEVTVKDESGRVVYRIPRKPLEQEFKIPGQPAGYYVLDANIYAGGIKAYYTQSGFAVNRPFAKLDPFFQFGNGIDQRLIPGYKRVGAGSIVMKPYMLAHPSILNRTPEWEWQTFQRENKGFLEDKDFELCITFGSTFSQGFRTPEQIQAGWPLLPDQYLEHLLDCVDFLHEKTKDRVREWAVQSEIPSNATSRQKCNSWTEAMFNQMLIARVVNRKLKAKDPDLKFWVGGNNQMDCVESIERIVMNDLVKDFDGYLIDGYTGNWNMTLGRHSIPELKLMEFYRLASNLSHSLGKGKIIRNAETGYAINYGACFDHGLAVEQACLTARTIILTKAGPVSRFELHMPTCYLEEYKNPKDDTVTLTTIWKPVYFNNEFYDIPLPGGAMFATAASELSFVKFLAEVKNGNIYCYLFLKPDGSVLITLWDVAENTRFFCDFPKNTAGVNMYGRTIVPSDLTIGPAPVYLTVKMPPEEAVSMMQKAVPQNAPEFSCYASPDKVYIRSLVSETRNCRLVFPGQKEQTVKLLPGKVNEIPMSVKDNGTLIAPNGKIYGIPLKQMDTYTVQKIKTKPILDGSGKWLEGLSSGILKYPDHIRPAEALQPERQYFRTSFNPNGHDISAQYWTAYDTDHFYLAVKVDDPIHQQRKGADLLWQDDSIQFVFSHESLAEYGNIPRSEYNFGLALTGEGTLLNKYRGKDHGVKNYPAKVTRTGNTTFYEVAIPWKEINGKPVRFGFVIFNNDWPTVEIAPYHLEFSAGITNGANDTKLKNLKYAE